MSTMNFCPSCGAKLIEGAAFCATCGAKLQEAVRPETAGTQQVDNLLAMARLAFGKKDEQEFTKYFDQIIAIDFRNLDAWIMKASRSLNKEDLEAFYEMFPDESVRQKFLSSWEENSPNGGYSNFYDLVDHALMYERIDYRLADIYIAKRIRAAWEEDKKGIDKLREGYKKEEKTEPSSVASWNPEMISINGTFKRTYQPSNFSRIADLVQKIDLPRYEKCLSVIAWYAELWSSFLTDAKTFRKWSGRSRGARSLEYDHYLEPAFYDFELEEFEKHIKTLTSIEQRFSTLSKEKYWLNHPEEAKERREKIQKLQEKIDALEKRLDKEDSAFEDLPVVQRYREISYEVERIRGDLDHLGLFSFSQKKAKKEQLIEALVKQQDLEAKYQEAEKTYESLCNDVTEQISKLYDQIQDVCDAYEPF